MVGVICVATTIILNIGISGPASSSAARLYLQINAPEAIIGGREQAFFSAGFDGLGNKRPDLGN